MKQLKYIKKNLCFGNQNKPNNLKYYIKHITLFESLILYLYI